MSKHSYMTSIAVGLITIYQALNHFKVTILQSAFGYVSVCKHDPSCSQFALKQIKNHGIVWGFGSGLWRLLTCW